LVVGALTLDVNELIRRGVLARGSRTRSVIRWFGPAGEQNVAFATQHTFTR
jgi:hypothetical protein